MGRARQQTRSAAVVSGRRGRDHFISTFGEGRGLSTAQRVERERRNAPRAFHATGEDGLETVSYYLNNDDEAKVLHREDGPACVETFPNGARLEYYHLNGERHREDGPSFVEYAANGQLVKEIYRQHDKHRPHAEGPSFISINEVGTRVEGYYHENLLDREDGPAQTTTYANGSSLIEYYRRNHLHREDGPAHIEIPGAGAGRIEKFYRNGNRAHPVRS